MAQRKPKKRESSIRDKNQRALWEAQRAIGWSPLDLLQDVVQIKVADDLKDPPEFASIDPLQRILWVNLNQKKALDTSFWTAVLGHLLLHLGLNHAARREERDPWLWNLACDQAADQMLMALNLHHGLKRDYAIGTETEEELYEILVEDARIGSRTFIGRASGAITLAGAGRPDIIGLGKEHAWNPSFEQLLADGIRQALQRAIDTASDTIASAENRKRIWRPLEQARSWVMNELPLLGALAADIEVICDGPICDRMDIGIAAVNGFLCEMYFRPDCGLTNEEVVFVYVHELLHVGLLHHSRLQGRDPFIWNLACDFVINAWLLEMGVGRMPARGALFDPRLQGMSAEEVYDVLIANPSKCKGLRGFRGKLGDVLWERKDWTIYRNDVTTLDDLIRRRMASGLACSGRGLVPAGLIEEIKSLFTPPVPWDVDLARWMEAHVPVIRDPLRTFARASRRQGSTPDIPRPARYVPQEWKDACMFGVVLDTSGSMDRELLGRALGAIASYAEARDVPAVRLVLCDAAPYDRGTVAPTELRGIVPIQGRGGTALQPAVNHLISRYDFPPQAPVMILTDGWCEERIDCLREHCFLLPRKREREGQLPLQTNAPVFRVLKEE